MANENRMAYEEDIVSCVSTLANHGIILYPTDTIWGIGCNALDSEAIEKIKSLKQRDEQKSFILLMTDLKQLSKFIAAPLPDLEDKLNAFSIPTTVVYPNAINLPDSILAPDGSIAARITRDPFCRSLIKRLKAPIVSTSANLRDEANPFFFNQISQEIRLGVDYIVKWRQNDLVPHQPSTILKLEKDGQFSKIR